MVNTHQYNGSCNLEMAQSNQGLIINKSNWKKRKVLILGGIVAILVIAAIIAAVVVFITSKNSTDTDGKQEAISLEDFLTGRTATRSFNATWVSDSQLLYRDLEGSVYLYNVKENANKTLLGIDEQLSIVLEVQNGTNASILHTAFSVKLSPDEKYILIGYNYRPLFRHSFLADYVVVDLATKEVYDVIKPDGTFKLIQLVTWGPVNNSLFYVHTNNIYYKSSVTSDEADQITSDGLFLQIYNGVPDWVYEEEVLSSNKALWVSPDGNKLVFAKFDDRSVQTIKLPVYGEPGQLTSQYTRILDLRYPKPGTKNPTVTLHFADLNTGNISVTELPIPTTLESEEPILVSVEWATSDTVVAIWMNRVQNKAAITGYDTSSNTSSIITNLEQANGWLELFVPPVFSKDGSQFILPLSQDQGGSLGSYRHITVINRSDGSQRALTKGTFVVKDVLGWDEENNLVYYQAPEENDPATQHVYSVSTVTNETNCITCNVTTSTTNSDCLYNSAVFSTDFSNYVLSCEGPGVPEISLHSINGTKQATWEDNDDVVELLEDKLVPTTERFTVTLADDFVAQVQLKLPPNLDRTGETKYPMLVNVYGGPDSYQITEKFGLDWGSYLSANKSIIYAMIDGRGSGLKGDKLLFEIFRAIGTVEVADQINITKYIQEKLSFVDATRTAIWGWSYGGYVAGMALATDTEGVFKCGISVAPVTDWTLYDSIYTERFMGLPTSEDNLSGYTKAQLLKNYEGIRDKEYLLIHGSLDDNVHYQQSMLWAKVLEREDILFRQQSYTDENHSLNYVRPHLYHTMESFLDECFIEKDKDSE